MLRKRVLPQSKGLPGRLAPLSSRILMTNMGRVQTSRQEDHSSATWRVAKRRTGVGPSPQDSQRFHHEKPGFLGGA